jgi:hypothetical protein
MTVFLGMAVTPRARKGKQHALGGLAPGARRKTTIGGT